MTSNKSFGPETTANDVVDAYSSQATGKIVLITGVSTGGIGDGTARAFAHGGASTVIITGRNDERLSKVVKELSAEYPSTKFRPLKLELNSLAVVRKSAQEILDDSSIAQLDIVVANAGGNYFNKTREVTADGIETHFGRNHLGHFLLITLLLPKLRAAAKKNPGATRVVMLSSDAMIFSGIRFSDWNFEESNKDLPEDERPNSSVLKAIFGVEETNGFEHNTAYAQSKTANTLFALHFNRLFASEGIYSFSVHPGSVYSAGAQPLWDSLTEEQNAKVAEFGIMKTIEQGSAPTLVAALDPALKPEALFIRDCQVGEAPAYAMNAEKAEKLWKLSEDLVASKLKN